MKKTIILLCAVLSLGAAFDASAQTLKVGTVAVKTVLDSYYKMKEAEQRINDARNGYKKEVEDRLDIQKKLGDEINKLSEEIVKPELSKESKEAKGKGRDEKIGEYKNMDRENHEFQTQRERQLQEQQMRMIKGILDEIVKVVNERAKAEQYDIIFDTSGMGTGFPSVLYAKDSYDLTQSVVTTLNKNKGSEPASAEAPAKATPAPKEKPKK